MALEFPKSIPNELQSKSEKKAAKNVVKEGPADFDTAISAAGYGKFNFLLLFIAIPTTFGTVYQSTTMSYILPVAECDLKMTLFQKGVLNAVTYGGMICSAVIWGYLADTTGRRKILLYGFLADGICVLCSSLSQNFEMLVVFKFIGGFIVNGPGAVMFTFVTEFHGPKHRPRVLMILGVITSVGLLVLPLLAWAIFPRTSLEFQLFGYLDVHSWQIFLFVCAIPSLVGGTLISFIPESPKFLMSQGRNAEALRAFQKIYAVNTGNPKDSYPIKELMEEAPSRDGNANEVVYTIENKIQVPRPKVKKTFLESLREGLQQIKPMFHKPLLGKSLHVYSMQFCLLLSLNTIRLWLPQLFASIGEYEANVKESGSDESTNLCTILEYSVNQTKEITRNYGENCLERKNDISVALYTNNIISAAAGLLGYLVAGSIIKLLGQKRMLTMSLLLAGICGICMYWATNGVTTLIISSCFVTIGGVATSSLLGLVVGLFPTSLRSLIVAIAMMCGRLGALSGNMLFPILMQTGCLPPFLMVGCIMLLAAALSCLLPSPKKTAFQ